MTTMTRCLLQYLYRCDLRLLLWFMHARERQFWIAGVRAVSRSGDGFAQVLLPSLLWLLDRDQGRALWLATAVAFALERPLYWVLKNSCQRRRPPEAIPSFSSVIQAADRFSFPSGHTAAAFLLATLTALHYGTVALPLYLWASAVGLSRVALGVHFPTDVLAGAALGSAIAWLTNAYLLAHWLA